MTPTDKLNIAEKLAYEAGVACARYLVRSQDDADTMQHTLFNFWQLGTTTITHNFYSRLTKTARQMNDRTVDKYMNTVAKNLFVTKLLNEDDDGTIAAAATISAGTQKYGRHSIYGVYRKFIKLWADKVRAKEALARTELAEAVKDDTIYVHLFGAM